uniref:Protein aurora borealis n=1 Tax=Heterorhabditis bacteriophora TaxID=37862 RepID=A0A1I7W7W8_HETBA
MEKSFVNCSVAESDGGGRFKNQLNSTAVVYSDDNSPADRVNKDCCWQPDLKFSPIPHDNDKRSVFSRRMAQFKNRGESPLTKTPTKGDFSRSLVNISEIQYSKTDSESGYRTRNTDDISYSQKENQEPGTSTPQRSLYSSMVDISSRINNPFDSKLLESIHMNTFSPSVFAVTRSPDEKDKEFKWSIEEMSILKPVHISDEEIAQCKASPDPEHEAKVQSILDEYWKNKTCYVPSPDGPRLLSHFIFYQVVHETPLSDVVRARQAILASCSTSSPKTRPVLGRRNSILTKRNRMSQTDLTIPPNANIDFSKILGDIFVYQDQEESDDEEEFNVSNTSITSLRRRLFTEDPFEGEEYRKEINMIDCDWLSEGEKSIIRVDLGRSSFSDRKMVNIDLSPIKDDESI